MADSGVVLTLRTVRKLAIQLLDLKLQLKREIGDDYNPKDMNAISQIDIAERAGQLSVLLIGYYGRETQGNDESSEEEIGENQYEQEVVDDSFEMYSKLLAISSFCGGLALGLASSCSL